MCSSSEFSSMTRKSPEKHSAFSQTCSRLSQYIKEKGGIGDLNLGISCTAESKGSFEQMYQKRSTTMNLFPMEEKLDNTSNLNNMAAKVKLPKNATSLNLFPQETDLSSSVAEEDLPNMVHTQSSVVNKSASEEQTREQMTIFYGGKVFVFDDFPAEKAKDVVSLANKYASLNHNTFAPSMTLSMQSIISKMVLAAVNSSTPSFTNVNTTQSSNHNLIQELSRQQSNRTVISDLPIARKASLHRFLEKRKDRIASGAPYQISSFVSGPSKPASAEGISWLQLAAPASH